MSKPTDSLNLFEKTLSRDVRFQGRIINLRVDEAELPNGRTAKREVVEHPGGVCIAALTDADELLFVRQFRYPYGEVLEELPAGKLERGEDPLEAGKRELKEETGLEGIAISQLGLYSAPRRDPRGWVVSQAFVATAKGFLRTRAGDDAGKAGWFSVNSEGIRRVSLTLTRGDTLLEIEAERVRDPVLSTDKAEIISSSGLAFDHAQMITDAWMRLGW